MLLTLLSPATCGFWSIIRRTIFAWFSFALLLASLVIEEDCLAGAVSSNCCQQPDSHRMQMWWTTRLASRTSCMRARLARLWCFVLTMFPLESLASSSIWSVLFCPPYEFLRSWMPSKGVKSSTGVKVFFQFPVRLWGKNRRTKGVHNRQRNFFKVCLFHFRLEDLTKSVSNHI